MTLNSSCYPIPEPSVVGKTMENGEAVLVLPGKGQVKVLNEIAARIWELADGTRSVAQIAEAITEAYQVGEQQAEQDVWDFLNNLASIGLLQLADDPKGRG